jgi:hypothetical protein
LERKIFLRGLLGRPGRYDLVAWVLREAQTEYFTQRDAVIGIGDNQGEVRSNLEGLVAIGLLEKTLEGRPHYRRTDSPVWDALATLVKAIKALEAGRAQPRLEPDKTSQGLPARRETVTIPRRRSRQRLR